MHLKTILYFILFGLMLGVSLSPAADFDLDYAVFRGSEKYDIIEVYLLIPRNIFEFQEEDGVQVSRGFIRAVLIREDTLMVDKKEWTIYDRLRIPDRDISQQKIPETTSLTAAPGTYRLVAVVGDLNTRETHRKEEIVQARSFSDELELSDIQLSVQVSKTKEKNRFSKYFGYDIIPNASNIFGEQHRIIYGFFEVYNLGFDAKSAGNYQVKYAITDLNGNEIQSQDWMTKKKPGDSSVEINGVDVGGLRSGLYNFMVSVRDPKDAAEARMTQRFYVIKDDREAITQGLYESMDLASLTEDELDEKFGPLKYIATEPVIRRFRKSNPEGKRQIITHFWDQRDPDPGTDLNEARAQYKQRLRYVKERFSTPQQEGWRTDMGRVFLIYGAPSEIERFPSSIETKPYQIWRYYEIEGGVEFIFVDKSGFGMMELVHSTARNELQDYDWQRWISPSSGSSSQMPY